MNATKTSPLLPALALFLLAAPLCLPASVQAGCGQGESRCVRFKAGKEVKSGKCETFMCANMRGGQAGARFLDERDAEDEPWTDKGMFTSSTCPEGGGECADNGERLDGGPAVEQANPVKGKGWLCYEKTGADEAMCVEGGFE